MHWGHRSSSRQPCSVAEEGFWEEVLCGQVLAGSSREDSVQREQPEHRSGKSKTSWGPGQGGEPGGRPRGRKPELSAEQAQGLGLNPQSKGKPLEADSQGVSHLLKGPGPAWRAGQIAPTVGEWSWDYRTSRLQGTSEIS